jgi:hypothetical protein
VSQAEIGKRRLASSILDYKFSRPSRSSSSTTASLYTLLNGSLVTFHVEAVFALRVERNRPIAGHPISYQPVMGFVGAWESAEVTYL